MAPPTTTTASTPGSPLPRIAGTGVFVVTAGLGAALAAPAPHWLDASEFAAAAFVLGNAHPPGHPLAIVLGKAVTLLPLGGLAFRANLASALALGVAAVLALFTVRRLVVAVARTLGAAGVRSEFPGQQHESPGQRGGPSGQQDEATRDAAAPRAMAVWPVSIAAALGITLAPPALFQGVRAEVYALNLALNLGLLLLALRHLETGSLRDLLLAGLLAGLGMGNHHLLTGAVVPALLAAALWRRRTPWRRTVRRLLGTAAAGLLGAFILLQLPARSRTAPPVNWGAPHTLKRFAWTVSAQLFQRTARQSVRASPLESAGRLARTAGAELGWGIGLALLAGLVLLARRRALWGTLLVLGLAAGANATAAVLAGFDPLNPDSLGYVLLTLACGAGLAGAALGAGIHHLDRAGAPGWLLSALAAGLLLWPLQAAAGGLPRADLREAYGAETAAETLLDAVPPGGLALSSYYQTGFGLWAAQLLSGARPDVDHVHRTFLGQPGYVQNRLRLSPHLRPLLAGLHSPGSLNAHRLRAEARRRAVRLEFDDDTVGPGLVRASLDRGGWLEVLPPGDPRAGRPQSAGWVARQLRPLQTRLEHYLNDPLTSMWLLWITYLDARYHLLRGECAAARVGWEAARRLGSPGDPLLRRLARRCGFSPSAAAAL